MVITEIHKGHPFIGNVPYGNIVVRGTLGSSLYRGSSGDTVEAMMASRIGVTLELGLLAILTGLIIAAPIGIYSAIRQYTVADYAGRSAAIVGLATPNFWLALLVIIYPAIWWGWTPPLTHVRFAVAPLANLTMFLFPALILGTCLAASTMRMTRTMMLEVLRHDYVRTAWAKGLQERRVMSLITCVDGDPIVYETRFMKAITINVSEPVYRDFQRIAKAQDRTASELIRQAMQEFRERRIARATTLADLNPASVGRVLAPLRRGDDLLGEMLDDDDRD